MTRGIRGGRIEVDGGEWGETRWSEWRLEMGGGGKKGKKGERAMRFS